MPDALIRSTYTTPWPSREVALLTFPNAFVLQGTCKCVVLDAPDGVVIGEGDTPREAWRDAETSAEAVEIIRFTADSPQRNPTGIVLGVWPDAQVKQSQNDTPWCSIVEPHEAGDTLIAVGPTADDARRNAGQNARALLLKRVEAEGRNHDPLRAGRVVGLFMMYGGSAVVALAFLCGAYQLSLALYRLVADARQNLGGIGFCLAMMAFLGVLAARKLYKKAGEAMSRRLLNIAAALAFAALIALVAAELIYGAVIA